MEYNEQWGFSGKPSLICVLLVGSFLNPFVPANDVEGMLSGKRGFMLFCDTLDKLTREMEKGM